MWGRRGAILTLLPRVFIPRAHCTCSLFFQVARANFNEDPYVRDFGIAIDTKMVNVTGRILPPPLLQYGGKVRHGVIGF